VVSLRSTTGYGAGKAFGLPEIFALGLSETKMLQVK
jgi:hypothetical protein